MNRIWKTGYVGALEGECKSVVNVRDSRGKRGQAPNPERECLSLEITEDSHCFTFAKGTYCPG